MTKSQAKTREDAVRAYINAHTQHAINEQKRARLRWLFGTDARPTH